MPNPVSIIAGATLITGAMSAKAQSEAAEGASEAQLEASRLGIEEQRRQFDEMQLLLQPYTETGAQAFERQGTIAGLQGPEAQKEFIRNLETSPIFKSLTEQGESAILQSASATGGLRGGNVQGALAQFRPALLNQFIEQEYSRLGGLANLGQASAAGVGAAGMRTGENVTNLITQGGQATAGNILAQGKIQADQWGNIGKTVGIVAGAF